MVRTKADRLSAKAVSSKAPRKVSANNHGKKSHGEKSAEKSYTIRNPYHPRETPKWQKPITLFINNSSMTTTNNEISSTKEKIENQASNGLNCEDSNAEENITEEDDEKAIQI